MHGKQCPVTTVLDVQPGSAEGLGLAERARTTLTRSPTLWVQTAHVADPVAWHGIAPDGLVTMALSAANPLVVDVQRHRINAPAVVAAAEIGPSGGPNRVLHRTWLAGWLREAEAFEFEELTRLITGTIRGPHVAQRIPDLRVLMLDVAEVLVPSGPVEVCWSARAGQGAIQAACHPSRTQYT